MGATLDCTTRPRRTKPTLRSRRQVAEKVAQCKALDSFRTSCRRIAGQLDVPARTLCHWVRRERTRIANSSCAEPVAQFLESPEGLDFLHQLLTSAHLVFVQASDCGLRNLNWFLRLSGLDGFVASSYGAQQAMAEEMESLLVRFGEEEDQRLAAAMSPQEITLCDASPSAK